MKVKKLLSAIIAIAMMTASSVGVTAFAEEGTTAILDTSESQTEATSETSVSDADAVAKIGDENYASLQSAIYNATSGQTVTLVDDVLLGKIKPFWTSGNDEYYSAITIGTNKKITLDLNHHSIKWSDEAKNEPDGEGKTGNYNIFWLNAGSELKVVGEGIIDGDVGQRSRWARIFMVKQGANLIIDSGEYYALQVILFNTYSGASATINGGTFGVSESYTNDEIANIINASGKNVLEKIYGGTFKGVDPRCFEDGDSAVAEGCKVSKKGDNYTVLSADTEAVASVIVPQEKLSGFAQSRNIGEYFYTSLADALAAAQDGDTIDLLDNTIELDGQTTIDKDVTITNGTFDITDAVCTTEGIIYIYNSSVKFSNVDLKGSNFTSAFGVIFANHNANVILDNCDFRLKNDLAPLGGTLKGNDNASFTVKNCTFDLENPSRVLTNITLDMSDTTIDAYVTEPTRTADDLNNHAFRNVYGVIKDSTIDVTGTETGLKNTDGGSLSITGTSNVSFTNTVDNNIYLADANETFTVAPTATLNGEVVYGTVSEATVTDEIAVNFVPTADENVYDIVLDGNYKEIYEFVSAEIQFINAGNGYQIDGTDDINVDANTDHPDRYGFYLKDGTLGNRITATKIKIGQVTFPAQGTISFKVDANNSKVVATKYNTHLEKSYTAADANAKLTADENGITGTIEAPTRNVAINVDFAHTLDNTGWNGEHQITVTLKDAFGDIVGEAEANPLAIADNAGTYTFENVKIGRITVTLKAPGFRTFTYTTTVEEGTDPLVLSFWNDTKRDTTAEVEPGKEMKNNFVVGDIAMDYIVDKYDLAAVTSYYGTYNLTDENKIKYDLNRDGNIDITDVAYVLHNFGF